MEAFTKAVEENDLFPKTDLTLVIEGQKLYVNKEILATHSPVFKTMFSSDFKEKTATEIELTGKTVEGFTEFLKCFYPNMIHEITEKNVLQILPIAHEYQSPLKAECEKFMAAQCNIERTKKAKKMSVYTLLDYVKAAEKYDLPKLLLDGIELCAYVSPRNLKGKITRQDYETGRSRKHPDRGTVLEVDSIASRYNILTPETRASIAERRVDLLEKIIETISTKVVIPDLCIEPWNSFVRL